jgi:signal transduction histidine kinase
MKNLFERFYRVEGRHESTYPGLGLGLYISKEIIERQGGTIAADSENGKGSTFSFTSPSGRTGIHYQIQKNQTYGKNTHRRG